VYRRTRLSCSNRDEDVMKRNSEMMHL
jgi:hypothetical protein